MSEIIARYNGEYAELQKQIEEAQTKAKALVKEVLPAAMKDFFTRHPEVYGIGWTQYAPHWNDGDACTFSVHEIQIWLDEESFDEGGFYDGDRYGLDESSGLGKDFAQIAELVEGIEEDYLEDIYGESVSVLFTKDGVEVAEYEHD